MPSPSLRQAIAVPAVLSLVSLAPVLGASQVGASPAAAPAAATGPSSDPRPNLVFVLADDLGWADLGSGAANGGDGNDFNETPRLDRLASEGQSFTEAYASVQCSPTRTALHTGQYAVRPTNNIYAVSSIAGQPSDPLRGVTESRRPNGLAALQTGYTTVGETLQQAGYATAYAGKFHVAATPEEIVASHGFDENWGGFNTGGPNNYFAVDNQFSSAVSPSLDQFAGDYTEAYVEENIAPYSVGVSEAQLDALVGTDKHVTDAVTDATLDFIGRSADEPFFAFVSQFAPHFPVNDAQARPDLLEKYRGKTPGSDPAKPSYGALVEGVDQSVARIIDYLEETPDPRNGGKPLAENTLVIFTSDNGGEEDPVIAGADNGPLREDKGWAFEGGVRVPWIVWSANPDLVKGGGRTNRTLVNSTDLYTTLASYAQAPLPTGVPLDGIDLRPAISRGATINRTHFHHLPGYVRFSGELQSRPFSSVRDGRWKLYYDYTDASFELYDLVADIGETTDLAEEQPGVVHQLGRQLIAWLDDTDAPLATLRPGQAPRIVEDFTGQVYAAGTVTDHRADTIAVTPGQQVPLLLPRP